MFFRLTLCLTVVVLGVALRAQAPSAVPADEEERRIAERLRVLEAESDRLTTEARTLVADLRKLEAERRAQVLRVREAQAAIAEGQAAIEGTAQRLLALEAERLAQLPAMQTQLVDMYKRGRTGFARLVFSAGGIREFGRATRAAAAMLRVSQERVLQHRTTIDALEQERAKLEMELEARRARETEAREAQAAVNKAVAERTAVLARIDSQRDVNARLAGELQVEQARLADQQPPPVPVETLPAAPAALPVAPSPKPAAPIAPPPPAAASRAPATTSAAAPVVAAPASPRAAAAAPKPVAVPALFGDAGPPRGTLLWPVSGRVTGRFGRKPAATDDPAAAGGVEIASREGNPVRALHAGVVTSAGPQGGLGNVVIVDHGNNTQSVYGYLSSTTVSQGARVTSGAELGRVGVAPGGVAMLFLEIRIDGRSVDPVQWLRPL
jgi:septal ring factor EnvC (AmiA/AmiB activator)